MFEKITGYLKDMFVKPDGSMNWRTLIAVGAGLALGGGALGLVSEASMLTTLIGGGIGLAASAALGAMAPSSEEQAPGTTPVVPAGPAAGAQPQPTVVPPALRGAPPAQTMGAKPPVR